MHGFHSGHRFATVHKLHFSMHASKCNAFSVFFIRTMILSGRFDFICLCFIDHQHKRVGKNCLYGKDRLKRTRSVCVGLPICHITHKSFTYKLVFRCNESEMYTIFPMKFAVTLLLTRALPIPCATNWTFSNERATEKAREHIAAYNIVNEQTKMSIEMEYMQMTWWQYIPMVVGLILQWWR